MLNIPNPKRVASARRSGAIHQQDLPKKLEALYKKYGRHFKIKTAEITLPVEMKKENNISGDLSYWTISYDTRNHELANMKLVFLDITKKIINNNAYVSNISKSAEFSGSQLIKFANELCDYLGVENTYIHDGAKVECGKSYSLSYYKLLQSGETFYMHYGYTPVIAESGWYVVEHKTDAQRINFLMETLENCRKVKTSEVVAAARDILKLCHDIVRTGAANKATITYRRAIGTYERAADLYEIMRIITNFSILIDTVMRTKSKKSSFAQFLTSIPCEDYANLIELVLGDLYSIKAGSHTANTAVFNNFYILDTIKHGTYRRTVLPVHHAESVAPARKPRAAHKK